MGCPKCQGECVEQCNWKWLRSPAGRKHFPLKLTLSQRRKLRFGRLLACDDCGQEWFLDESRTMLYLLEKDQLPLFERWSRRALRVPAAIRPKLAAIGATPPDLYGNDKEFIWIPCAAKFKKGGWTDLALISLQKIPPVSGLNYKKTRFLDEVADVRPSAYAVPRDVRAVAAKSEEILNGYQPTFVSTSDGKAFTLVGTVNFVKYRNVKGRDIRLRGEGFSRSGQGMTTGERYVGITLIVGDWMKGDEKLRIGK